TLFRSLKLPKPEEPPETPQDELAQRVEEIAEVDRALVGLFRVFLEARVADGWPHARGKLSAWIRSKAAGKRVAEKV
ncbi:MAG: hypothetical protein ACF8NJ_08245, partial [Phycisphaerales bacterium JB038]